MKTTPPSLPFPITDAMVRERGQAHSVPVERAVFHLTEAGLLELTRELIAGAYGVPWPPAPAPLLAKRPMVAAEAPLPQLTDSQRLDTLEKAGGFIAGTDAGKRAYRVFGFDQWHESLRAAADAISGGVAEI